VDVDVEVSSQRSFAFSSSCTPLLPCQAMYARAQGILRSASASGFEAAVNILEEVRAYIGSSGVRIYISVTQIRPQFLSDPRLPCILALLLLSLYFTWLGFDDEAVTFHVCSLLLFSARKPCSARAPLAPTCEAADFCRARSCLARISRRGVHLLHQRFARGSRG